MCLGNDDRRMVCYVVKNEGMGNDDRSVKVLGHVMEKE